MSESSQRAGVGVIGGSGYIGAELLRYLSTHPGIDVRWVTAHSKAGKPVGDVLPNLSGFVDLEFVTIEELPVDLGCVRVVFVALPHNKSQEVIPDLATRFPEIGFIDMGGDFRTPDPAGYERYYGRAHAAPEWLGRFVFGFTEFQREALKLAQLVANPGCFASSLLVGLTPLVNPILNVLTVIATYRLGVAFRW